VVVARCQRRDQVEAVVEAAACEDLAQVRVAAPVDREQQRLVGARGDGDAEDRAQPLAPRVLQEADREVEVVAIGEREGLEPSSSARATSPLGRRGAVEQRAVQSGREAA
jgi:hypothetical protein